MISDCANAQVMEVVRAAQGAATFRIIIAFDVVRKPTLASEGGSTVRRVYAAVFGSWLGQEQEPGRELVAWPRLLESGF